MTYAIMYGLDTDSVEDPTQIVYVELPDACGDMDADALINYINDNDAPTYTVHPLNRIMAALDKVDGIGDAEVAAFLHHLTDTPDGESPAAPENRAPQFGGFDVDLLMGNISADSQQLGEVMLGYAKDTLGNSAPTWLIDNVRSRDERLQGQAVYELMTWVNGNLPQGKFCSVDENGNVAVLDIGR